jgi:hypothetical protein
LVELITASAPGGLYTPRFVISELMEMRKGEGWYRDRMAKITKHLERTQFRGQCMLDVPMSLSGVDAVIKEAWAAVKDRSPVEELIANWPKTVQ